MSLVITGNPGVGKHTIAKKIAVELGLKLIDINKIALEAGVSVKSKETRDVDVDLLKPIIRKKISKESLVVGHLAPYVLTKSQVSKAIILRKSPYKLPSIYKKRNYSKKKIAENLESEIIGIIAHDTIKKIGKEKTIQIDTTNKTIQKVLSQIKSAIKGKKISDTVDWLDLVTKKNDLQKFFSY